MRGGARHGVVLDTLLDLLALLFEALFDFGFSGEGVDGSEENVTY